MLHDPIVRCIKSVTHHHARDERMCRYANGTVADDDDRHVVSPRDFVGLILYRASISINEDLGHPADVEAIA